MPKLIIVVISFSLALMRPRISDLLLHKRVVESFETQVSDSATDEVRAGHMNAGQTVTETLRETVNMRVVVRDKPHCSRRNTGRNYAADPFLKDVQTRFIFGSKSPIKLIKESEQFSAWFAANVQKLDAHLTAILAHRGIKDLRFAAHRYDSSQKPFGRCVLFFHAVLATMVQISQARKGRPEGIAAAEFLHWLDNEKALQLAMMADAGDENMILTRF